MNLKPCTIGTKKAIADTAMASFTMLIDSGYCSFMALFLSLDLRR